MIKCVSCGIKIQSGTNCVGCGVNVPSVKLSRYHRIIRADIVDGFNHVDVYAVLKAFNVTDQAIGHAIKKLLDAGNRGVKSKSQDWKEAVMSIEAAIKLDDK